MIVAEIYRIRKLFLHDGLPCTWSGDAIENMSAAAHSVRVGKADFRILLDFVSDTI